MTLHYHTRRFLFPILLALSGATLLSGCAPLVVGGAAATTAVVATDRRTAGEQLDDQTIELKVGNDIRAAFPDSSVRVNAMSYGGVVLLTGDVPNQADSQRAQKLVSEIERVQRVINRLRIGDITPLSVRSNDTWLTSKVRTALINTKGVPSRTIVVTTERGVVYMMGRVTRDEGELAAKAASRVTGVNQVVTLFDFVSRERLLLDQETNSGQGLNNAAPAAQPSPTPAAPASSGDVQVMPIQ